MEVTGNAYLLRGVAGTASLTVTDSSVSAFGAATVTITAHDGSALVTDAAATGTAGVYSYRLSAALTANLDILTLAWTVQVDGAPETLTTVAEVIGGHLFSIAEARAFDQKQLTNAATFPDSLIDEARGRILDTFQDICGAAFVPRYRESIIRHDGGYSAGDFGGYYQWSPADRPELLLPFPYPRKVRSIDVSYWAMDWVAWDITLSPIELTPEGLVRTILPHGTLRIRYEHGLDAVPAAIKKAALQVLLFELLPDNTPERATSVVMGDQTYRLSTADGIRKYYGIPTVDSALARYAFSTIG